MIAAGRVQQETMAVVLAGGKGTRLGPLTRHISKPALPFGAAYRNIDFSLANCVNSNIRRIGVAIQHQPESLIRHLDGVWRKAARRRGEFIAGWTARDRAPREGYTGTADAVYRNLDLIEREQGSLVLVLAGDHVYRMDYRPMIEFHRRRQADVTVGCIEVPAAEASQFGILSTDRAGRIVRFVEKPKCVGGQPDGRVLASMGIYVFDKHFLGQTLRRDAFSSGSRHDFGGDILPGALCNSNVYAYPFQADDSADPGYWRDVGTPAAYWRAHLELLDDASGLRLDDERWPLPAASGRPVLTDRFARRPGREMRDLSLIAANCEVAGSVHRSVLFDGVRLASGSVVERAVVLPGAVIGRNCHIADSIVDSGCRIPDGTIIGPERGAGACGASTEPLVITAEDIASEPIYAYA